MKNGLPDHWSGSNGDGVPWRAAQHNRSDLKAGVHSRPLGLGGAELASKSQILSHFETALADLLARGRVNFLSQCEYVGDGGVRRSLQVRYRRKLVDAIHCETHVPATSKPNFSVEKDVKFVAAGCLSNVKYVKYVR